MVDVLTRFGNSATTKTVQQDISSCAWALKGLDFIV